MQLVVQNYGPKHICLLPFLTHFADLSSWEYAKKLKAILPQIEDAGIQARLMPKVLSCSTAFIGIKTSISLKTLQQLAGALHSMQSSGLH